MKKKVIVALDNQNLKQIVSLVKKIKSEVYGFKIGKEFFYNYGIEGYKKIYELSPNIFLDLKLHDIPNTVKKGMNAISKLEPYFVTIHISGGDNMLKAANLTKNNIKILGVSILTSLNSDLTKKYYYNKNIETIVSNYTQYALENNLDGIVCSPKEISIVKNKAQKKLLIITPGIRPINYDISNDDQSRTMTPKEAIKAGADYLVIGRPITQSKNPLKILKSINDSLE